MDAIFRPQLTRVVLTGSESTGKTSLGLRLAEHYGVECVPEFVRTFAAEKGAAIDFSDHGRIAFGQIALENEYAERADRLLFHDTDLVSTVVYCDHYFGRTPSFIVDLAMERKADLYLLGDIDVPWIADGIRDRGDRREEMHAAFMTRLIGLDCNYEVVIGTFEERFERALALVNALNA